MREEGEILEDRIDRAAVCRNVKHAPAVKGDVAGGGPVEAAYELQERALAATGRSEQREEFPGADGQIDAAKAGDRAEHARDTLDVDGDRHVSAPPVRRWRAHRAEP